MIRPPALKKGDKVRIVSTARKITHEEVAPAVKILEDWGWEVDFGAHLFEEHHQFAGTVGQRINDLQLAMDDPEVRAILCARGGYGTVQVIDALDFSGFLKDPKWIVGYSDVTVLHSHIHTNYGIQTLHASMPVNFSGNTAEALASLRKALSGRPLKYSFSGMDRNRPGTCEGVLVGGNLSILYSLTGTSSSLDTKGKLFFMEDLDEYLYHVDRMMMNLKRAGMMDGPAGLLVGGMTDMNDNEIAYGYSAEETIEWVVGETSYPIAFRAPFGHLPDNRTLILGSDARMEVDKKEVSLQME